MRTLHVVKFCMPFFGMQGDRRPALARRSLLQTWTNCEGAHGSFPEPHLMRILLFKNPAALDLVGPCMPGKTIVVMDR